MRTLKLVVLSLFALIPFLAPAARACEGEGHAECACKGHKQAKKGHKQGNRNQAKGPAEEKSPGKAGG